MARRRVRRRRRNPVAAPVVNPRRRRRRRVRKNVWRGHKAGHRRAALKGWRRRRRKSAAVAPKRRRRRSRRRYAGRRRYGSSRRRRRSRGRVARRRIHRIPRRRRVAYHQLRAAGMTAAQAYRLSKARGNPRRRRRRRRRRRNPGLGMPSLRSVTSFLGPVAAAWVASRVLSGLVQKGMGYVPMPAALQRHTPTIGALATVGVAHVATTKVAFLRKWRTPIMIAAGLNLVDKIITSYLAPYVPAQVKPWLGLGQIPAYWESGASSPYQHAAMQGMGEYIEVPPGVGLGQFQEAAAGMGEYFEVPPGAGMLEEAAAGMGEYVEVLPGMSGLGMIEEAAAGLGASPFGVVGAGWEGHRMAGAPTGMIPMPRTLTPGQAAYEGEHSGGGGIFGGGGEGIFGG